MQIAELVGVDLDYLGVLELEELLEGAKVDIIGRIDGLSGTEDTVGDRHTTAKLGRVFDIVDPLQLVSVENLSSLAWKDSQERRRMEHSHNPCDYRQACFWNLQPRVERRNELLPNVFPGVVLHVLVRSHYYPLFLL